jgi:hypothetical protein
MTKITSVMIVSLGAVLSAQTPDRGVPEPKPYIWLSPTEIRALPIAGDPGCTPRCS